MCHCEPPPPFVSSDDSLQVGIKVFQGEREMAAQNKLLGQFELVGIPPAPRGVPQIEVTFDIDANGIVNVSAKDKGTGKEQAITIQSSGGLSDEEIQKMCRDAEEHAEEDRLRKESVEVRNKADQTVYQAEKALEETYGDKVPEDKKEELKAKIEKLKGVLANDGATGEEIQGPLSDVEECVMECSKILYESGQSASEEPPKQ